jgi:hypothetical protein
MVSALKIVVITGGDAGVSLIRQISSLGNVLTGHNLNTPRLQVPIEGIRPIRMSNADIVPESSIRIVAGGAEIVITHLASGGAGIAGYAIRNPDHGSVLDRDYMGISLAFSDHLLPIERVSEEAFMSGDETTAAVAGVRCKAGPPLY